MRVAVGAFLPQPGSLETWGGFGGPQGSLGPGCPLKRSPHPQDVPACSPQRSGGRSPFLVAPMASAPLLPGTRVCVVPPLLRRGDALAGTTLGGASIPLPSQP